MVKYFLGVGIAALGGLGLVLSSGPTDLEEALLAKLKPLPYEVRSVTCLTAAPGETQRRCLVKYTPKSGLPNTTVMLDARPRREKWFEHSISVVQKFAPDDSSLSAGPYLAKRTVATPHSGGHHADEDYATQVNALLRVAIQKSAQSHGKVVYEAAVSREVQHLTGNAVLTAKLLPDDLH